MKKRNRTRDAYASKAQVAAIDGDDGVKKAKYRERLYINNSTDVCTLFDSICDAEGVDVSFEDVQNERTLAWSTTLKTSTHHSSRSYGTYATPFLAREYAIRHWLYQYDIYCEKESDVLDPPAREIQVHSRLLPINGACCCSIISCFVFIACIFLSTMLFTLDSAREIASGIAIMALFWTISCCAFGMHITF